MNVVYYSSDFFSEMCGVSIESLLENNTETDEINIYIVEDNISDINKYIEVLTNNIKENSINNVGNSSEVENQVNILNSIVKNLQQLTERDRMEEFMFLGLRMMEGVSMEKFEQYFGKPYMEVYGKVQKRMEDKRFLINDNGYVKLTEFGIDLSNYVMSEFLF